LLNSIFANLNRYYTAKGIEPAFPFGHGLSYTTFAYKGLSITPRLVEFDVINTGDVSGAEVAQM
jgi:beta-glucosidase